MIDGREDEHFVYNLKKLKLDDPDLAARDIVWPVPYILRKSNILSFIDEQERDGFIAECNYERVPVSQIIDNWGINPFRDKGWLVRLHSLQVADPYIIAYKKG